MHVCTACTVVSLSTTSVNFNKNQKMKKGSFIKEFFFDFFTFFVACVSLHFGFLVVF